MNPPRQTRSRQTRDRIVSALGDLLRDRPFESISVAEAARRAGVTTGAFYGRFSNKNAILATLYEDHDRELHGLVEDLLARRSWEGLTLREMVVRGVAWAVAHYRERRWVLRALALFARTHPEAVSEECRRLRRKLHQDLAGILMERRHEMAGDRVPEAAVAFSLLMVGAVCRDKILFGDAPHAASTDLTDGQLAAELGTAVLAYLGASR